MRTFRSFGPLVVSALSGIATTWLTWPDLHSAHDSDSQLAIVMVVLSFLIGPGSLLVAYAPAVLAGVVAALLTYIVIRAVAS